MNNLLKRIYKNMELNKESSKTIKDVNLANIEDPYKYADEILISIIDNLEIEGLEEED